MIDMGAPNFIALFLLRIPNMVSLKNTSRRTVEQ